MISVLLAVDDARFATGVADLASESGAFTVAQTVTNAGELIAALELVDCDAIVVHADLRPLPVVDLAREIMARRPDVGLVLLTEQVDAEVLAAALRAGFRGVARLPLALEDLGAAVEAAGSWSQAVRSRLTESEHGAKAARMLAVAGAKGGVGTTTVAVHLALQAARRTPERSVCLVDFDLQAGDVRSYLDLTHRRSVADLVDVASDLTSRQLDESLSAHPSGLRVLLPPPEGERAEDISGEVARRILGALRTRFDVVIVDVGSVVTEGGAVATELADETVIVTTPDVPSMRAANRLLELWERLRIRKDHVRVLVNRFSRDSEVQPELVARVVSAPVLKSTLPSDFRALEAAANTGDATRLEDGPVARGLDKLVEEVRVAPRRQAGRRLRSLGGRPATVAAVRAETGGVSAELVGMTYWIILVMLLLWQLVLAGYTAVLGTHAAREAARELAVTELADEQLVAHLEDVARADLPPSFEQALQLTLPEDDRVRLSLRVPLLVPGIWTPVRIAFEQETFRETATGGLRPPEERGAACGGAHHRSDRPSSLTLAVGRCALRAQEVLS